MTSTPQRSPEQKKSRAEREKKRRQEQLEKSREDAHLKNSKRVRLARTKHMYTIQDDGYLNCGRMEHECQNCGALHWLAERSIESGSTLSSPKFHKCCSNGQIVSHSLIPSVCSHCSFVFRDENGSIRAPEPQEICFNCKKAVPEPLPSFQNPPPLLRLLLTSQGSRAKHFRKCIRQYNNAFAMGSVKANFVARGPEPRHTIQL